MKQTATPRSVSAADLVFAPGHLGELTRLVPSEMLDELLDETSATQRRTRLLPARVVVYLLLAGCLFAEIGYRQVWQKLTAGLQQATWLPSSSAIRQAQQRLGAAPLRALFDLLRGPAPTSARDAVWWRGLLLTVIDGTVLSVADSAPVRAHYPRQTGLHGGAGYPSLRLSALLTCGTRSIIDAVYDPISTGEPTQARRLAVNLHAGMLLLADRNYAAADLIGVFAATGAHLLIRCKTGRRLPPLRHYPDGSWLSILGGVQVRVVQAHITLTTPNGTHSSEYRLVTTLTDPGRYPATELIALYHQRWEIETAYLELKSSILGGRVLRARTVEGIDQEVHALLTVYQLLRTAMVDATDSQPGLDPDRASFTTALQAARDQLILAAGILTDTVVDLVGVIGARVLATPLPDRRLRIKPRTVKRSNSKYQARGTTDRRSYQATITIDLITTQP